MVFETYYICGCSFCIQVAWSSVIVIPSCVLKFWCENQHEFSTFKHLDAWNLVCLCVRGARGMLKIFGTKIQFHSCPLKFLWLRWHSYVHSKTWSCWKKCLTFDSVCESVCVNLREFATRLTNECFVSLSSCPILMSNLTFWFSSSVTFFMHATKALHRRTWFFKRQRSWNFFRLDGAVWHASFSHVKNVAFLKVEFWMLEWPCLGHSKLQKKFATLEEFPSGCQNNFWKMCEIFRGLWRGLPMLCWRSAICGCGCRHQMCMLWIMGIRDRC